MYRQKDTDGAAVSVDSGDTPALRVSSDDDNGESEQIGYVGLFFSTFFGGHDEEYATPREQHVWFKDFRIRIEDGLEDKGERDVGDG